MRQSRSTATDCAARFEASLPAWARPPSQGTNGAADEPPPDLFGFTLRAADIWSRVSAYVAAGSRNSVDRRVPWHPASTFQQLDRALHEWTDALPDRLRHTAENLRTHVFVGQGQLVRRRSLHRADLAVRHLPHPSSRCVDSARVTSDVAVSVLTLHRDYLPFLPPRGSYDVRLTDLSQLLTYSPPTDRSTASRSSSRTIRAPTARPRPGGPSRPRPPSPPRTPSRRS